MKKYIIILILLIAGCSSGPHISNKYNDEKGNRDVTLSGNRLGGSEFKNDCVHWLYMEFYYHVYSDGNKNYELQIIYYGNYRIYENEKVVELLVDGDTVLIDNPYYYEAAVKENAKKSLCQSDHQWREWALFKIPDAVIKKIALANNVRVIKLGKYPNPDWYFNEENKAKIKEFYGLCEKY